MNAILKRMQVPNTSLIPQVLDFASTVGDKLGYWALVETTSRSNEDTALMVELIAMGYVPYTSESVKRYQTRMENTFNFKMVRTYIVGMIVSVLVLATIIYQMVTYVSMSDWKIIPFIGSMLGTAGCLLRALFLLGDEGYEWRYKKLSIYSSPIPKSVLTKALDIKERTSKDIEFGVVELVKNEYVADPFLTVCIKRNTRYNDKSKLFYIDVWNEPTFEDVTQEKMSG